MKKIIKIVLLLYFKLTSNNISFIDGDYWFAFPTVSLDYSNESIIDMSYLNWKIEEKIKVKEGHFYYKDKRVKFFGTNSAFDSSFPLKENASKIAKRLAQLGINIIRFFCMDLQEIWGDNYEEIQENNKNSKISEKKLDKFHYFLHCLKENGIYANIVLHSCRTYPEIINNKEINDAFVYGKPLDKFYPQFINDQLKFSKDLLDSYNNYTGFKVGEDPMTLCIELNNENTMFALEDEEDKVEKLNDKLKKELLNQWRNFIKQKYNSFDEINSIYNNESINIIENLIENNTISIQNDYSNYIIENNNHVIFNITGVPSIDFINQIHYGYINISNYTQYTIEFDAKAKYPTNDTLSVHIEENLPPYRSYFRIKNIKITNEFNHYVFSGRTEYNCQFSEKSRALVKIVLPPIINIFEIKNTKFYKGRGVIKFTEDGEENLDKILYPDYKLIQSLPNMAYDLRLFFKYTETKTQNEITNYIKNDLSFKDLLIYDSQVYYSFYSYEKEYDNSDICDIHGYWGHPEFEKGHDWDMNYYTIYNQPMIKSSIFGTFNSISKGKCFNKPFTVSEYNHPFPNEFLHEKFAMFGSWSAYHDYDAIYQYSYDQPSEKEKDYIAGIAEMATNPIDLAMIPYIILAFRKNYIEKSKDKVLLKLTKGYINEKMREKKFYMEEFLDNFFYAGWNAIYEVEIMDNNNYIEPEIISDIDITKKEYFMNEQIQWKNYYEGNEAYYNVINERYITLTGFLGNMEMNKENNLGSLIYIKVKLNEALNETCTIGLISLDDKKLINSEKLLLTIVGKVRNTNQQWNKERNSTYSKGWGTAPVLVQYIEIEVCLKFKEEEKPKVFSIDKYGKINKEFKLEGNVNNWILKSDEDNPTLNYYIIRKIVNKEEIEKNKERIDNTNYTVIIIVIILIIIICIGIIIFFIRRKRRRKNYLDNNDIIKNFLGKNP